MEADQILTLQKDFQARIGSTLTPRELQQLKTELVGKKGALTQLTKSLSKLSTKEKSTLGKKINQTKQILLGLLEIKEQALTEHPGLIKLPKIDPTFPGIKPQTGHLHPITQVTQRAVEIFQKMGFEVWQARLVDDKYHNYLSLNFPEGHPAMDIMDTLWINDNLLPITHTSSMQNRVLRSKKPPLSAIVLGRCFRREATDPTHEHTFHQLEGVFVDEKVSLSDLIGTLKNFLESFFERELKIKVQPSFFPFVEPGIEIMAECIFCHRKSRQSCKTCGGSGWIELVPAGMIHPNVLKDGGVDPKIYSGFAWAIGLDRLSMLTFGIDDIRWFHSGDLRFLQQFVI